MAELSITTHSVDYCCVATWDNVITANTIRPYLADSPSSQALLWALFIKSLLSVSTS